MWSAGRKGTKSEVSRLSMLPDDLLMLLREMGQFYLIMLTKSYQTKSPNMTCISENMDFQYCRYLKTTASNMYSDG